MARSSSCWVASPIGLDACGFTGHPKRLPKMFPPLIQRRARRRCLALPLVVQCWLQQCLSCCLSCDHGQRVCLSSCSSASVGLCLLRRAISPNAATANGR